jgi:hypothetical protein
MARFLKSWGEIKMDIQRQSDQYGYWQKESAAFDPKDYLTWSEDNLPSGYTWKEVEPVTGEQHLFDNNGVDLTEELWRRDNSANRERENWDRNFDEDYGYRDSSKTSADYDKSDQYGYWKKESALWSVVDTNSLAQYMPIEAPSQYSAIELAMEFAISEEASTGLVTGDPGQFFAVPYEEGQLEMEGLRWVMDTPHLAKTSKTSADYDKKNNCTECGEHIADPHQPGCKNDPDNDDDDNDSKKSSTASVKTSDYWQEFSDDFNDGYAHGLAGNGPEECFIDPTVDPGEFQAWLDGNNKGFDEFLEAIPADGDEVVDIPDIYGSTTLGSRSASYESQNKNHWE